MAATMNMTLYRLLLKTGANEADAEAAARIDTTDLVTKADLTAAINALRADLLKWMIGLLISALGLQAGLLLFLFTHYAKP
jgi:hypothetical protein